jgi:hypothetical protein
MWKSAALAAVVTGVAVTAQAAQATELYFDLTISDSNKDYATWTQSATPSPRYTGVEGTDINVSNASSSLGTFSHVFYGGPDVHGGFQIYSTNFLDGVIFEAVGPQIFGGTYAAPIFSPGTIQLTPAVAYLGDTEKLTITAVPEPATWTLMIVGIGGLGAALRASRRSRLVAQTA